MKVKELKKALQNCDDNWEIVLLISHKNEIGDRDLETIVYPAHKLNCGHYSNNAIDCAPSIFQNSGLDIDGLDINSILIT